MEINKIYHGDCYKLIKEIPDHSIDLIYTDIPYDYTNGGFGGGRLKSEARRKTYINTIGEFDKGIDWGILDEFCRIMKHIYIYIWCSKEQIPHLLNYFIGKGCLFNILVWCKTNPTPFANETFLPDVEYCLTFREAGYTRLNNGYANKSKWYISSTNVEDKKEYGHATIKPLELVKRHLKHSCQKDFVVFDPFVGSGTTCVAAKELGFNYLGFEINKKYYKIAQDRLNGINQHGQMSLLDTNFEQLDLFKGDEND